MGQVVKFLGVLLLSIAATLVIFTHISMLFVYNVAYVVDTLWPSDPESTSSILIGLLALIPGFLMIGAGYLIEKYVPDVDDVPAKSDDEDTPPPATDA